MRRVFYLGSFFLFLYIIFIFIFIQNVGAGTENKAKMEDGEIKYGPIKDTSASSRTTWSTEGFTIKNKKTFGDPTKKPYGQFMLKSGYKQHYTEGDNIFVTFVIPEDVVSKQLDAADVNAKSLKESGGKIYLNGIIQVYEGGHGTGEYYRTLKGIQNARGWSNPRDFDDRFDIEVAYDAKPKPVDILYQEIYQNNPYDLKVKKCNDRKVNTIFKTDGTLIPDEMTSAKNGKKIRLYQVYYVDKSKPSKKLAKQTVTHNPKLDLAGWKADANRIRNREFTVPAGGLRVVAVYRQFANAIPPEEGSKEISSDLQQPDAKAIIQAESRDNELFEVTDGIPTSESLYANVFAREYLPQYRFVQTYGKKIYTVTVERKYYLTWTSISSDAEGNPISIPQSTTQTVQRQYQISREYSYWTVKDLNIYRIKGAVLNNYALPGSTVSMTPLSYQPPSVQYQKTNTHLKEPAVKKVILSSGSVNGGTSRPSIPFENWEKEAQSGVGEIIVQNDSVIFNGKVHMNAAPVKTHGDMPIKIPSCTKMIHQNVLYAPNLYIDGRKSNGTFESTGTIEYEGILNIGECEDFEGTYDIDQINDVVLHTPVVCDARIQDEKEWNQMITPDRGVAGLVLDTKFFIKLPTVGIHQFYKGYGYRDYGKYIQSREVKFSFDIVKENKLIKANTWIMIYQDETEWYLPTWVKEGYYNIQFRSTSINSDANGGYDKTEENANYSLEHYVATDQIRVQISGRLYDMQVYDISDYPLWKAVFRKTNSLMYTGFTYKTGDKDRNGIASGQDSRYTFPIINGSHPYEISRGALTPGYMIRYQLHTIGTMNGGKDSIKIKPIFYYVNRDGTDRQAVDVYYTETFLNKRHHLVKMGGSLDQTNQKPYGSTFLDLNLPVQTRTYTGKTAYYGNWLNPNEVLQSMQQWKGEYYIPADIHVVPKDYPVTIKTAGKGINYQEDFWLKDGYLILNFQIETYKEGERHLSYINSKNYPQGYCNMWRKEGFQPTRVDASGASFHMLDGDLAFYDLKRSAASDYINSGTH